MKYKARKTDAMPKKRGIYQDDDLRGDVSKKSFLSQSTGMGGYASSAEPGANTGKKKGLKSKRMTPARVPKMHFKKK